MDPVTGAPAAAVAPPAAPAPVSAPLHPAAVQPAPATATAPTINYNFPAPSTPPAAPVPTAPPPMPGSDQTVTIPLSQLQAFTSIQARLAEMEASDRAQREAAQRAQAEAQMRQGQLEDGLRMLREQSEQQLADERQRVVEVQRQAQTYAIDMEVARAMVGHTFASDRARRAFESEIRAELVAEANGNTFVVRTPTFQSAADLVASRLANPEYAFLLAPRGAGGTANGQPSQALPTPPATPPAAAPAPANMGEAVIAYMNSMKAASGDARYNPSLSMGLKRQA